MELLLDAAVTCPHCGEPWTTVIDTSQRSFATIEDCPVCCRPIALDVQCAPGRIFSVAASAQ